MATNISGVGSISSAGLGSGLDVNSIVASLMAIEARPLDILKDQAKGLDSQLSTFGKLQSHFSALRDKSNALTSSSLWNGTTATSADPTALKVLSGAGTAAGSYQVQVSTLAKSQTLTASAAASSTFNEGSITIELGAWTGAPIDTFTAKASSVPVTIDIAAGETSIEAVRDKINGAGAGVIASIVNDANGARLSIRSKDTGLENGFRITTVETVGDADATAGLSALDFDPAGGLTQMTAAQMGSNATLTVNGIAIESASNSLVDVVDGLTLNLLKTTAAPVDVSVAVDSETVKTKVTEFVTAFNDLANFMRTQMAYNPDSKTGGALQGDRAAVSLLNQLRGVINLGSTASGTWSRLSEVGISMKTDGTLAIDSTKLGNGLANLPELKKLLAFDGVDSESTGFMRRFKELADSALGAEGTFETRNSSLKDMLSRNGKNQDAYEVRLSQTEARLRKQYTALDATMAQLNGLSSYLGQQLKALSINTQA
ncbi:flagellar filament capping protein FliD [Aquincola sp. S2]|uniref:Flagellar hook-associated protein 2 n=1 Tax=Pseudaquabacterium terrae TaxID=2732868 RepID=A0ABX2ENU2_9BURK|nr:flagellar filament capping protein FliD [Aquabacterium terrae]NRF70211.1 flagellar filament capping protein FliD [Aquabacterium terrae]